MLSTGHVTKHSRRAVRRRGITGLASFLLGIAVGGGLAMILLTWQHFDRMQPAHLPYRQKNTTAYAKKLSLVETNGKNDIRSWKLGQAPPISWYRPIVRGASIAANKNTQWDIETDAGRKQRRACVQKHLFAAHGLDTLKEYFMQGCNVPPMHDFLKWAAETGCGKEPLDEPLLVHTAWSGPYEHVREDLDALIDSFLMTQDLSRTKLIFWFLEEPVDKSSSFVRKYENSNNAVEFREARLKTFAKGTSMEGRPDFLDLNWSTVKKGPRWKANLFRVLALHRFGGVWVDTDSVLLRDLRPLIEFSGEFASKLTMSLYYNNNVMGLRKGSPLSRAMVEDIVATPLAENSKRYCKHVGNPCYPKWTWNHGLIQLAVRQQRGIVIFPTTYTDPAYGCFPQWLLGKSGGEPMHTFTIHETLEFIRGAFVLHSRAYKTTKPMNPRSNYGRLYSLAAKGAAAAGQSPVSLVKTHRRNVSEELNLGKLFERRGEFENVVDPPFVPRSPWRAVLVKSKRWKTCINAVRHVKGEMYGGNPELLATANCDAAAAHFNETVVFLWHSKEGFLRPAHREPGRVLCADALTLSAHSTGSPYWNAAPKMITCNSNRPTQQWVFIDSRLANPYTGLCAEVTHDQGRMRLVMRVCSSTNGGQNFEILNFTGDGMPYLP